MQKRITITLLLLVALCQYTMAQSTVIAGVWMTEDNDAQVEVSHQGKICTAKLVWMKDAKDKNGNLKKDENNPDKSLRQCTILGMNIATDWQYNKTENQWSGHIYDPQSGNHYTCTLRMPDNDTLIIHGYILGLQWLGQDTHWRRKK